MKKYLFLLFIIFLVISCSENSPKSSIVNTVKEVKNNENKNLDTANMEVLSDTVKSVISLDENEDKPPFFTNFNKKEFLDSLILSVLDGRIKGYDYFDFTPKSVENIKEDMGLVYDTVAVEDAMTGKVDTVIKKPELDIKDIRELVFIEKWKWNRTTDAITKEVIAYGPVIYVVKDDSLGGYPVLKRVPFIVFVNGK